MPREKKRAKLVTVLIVVVVVVVDIGMECMHGIINIIMIIIIYTTSSHSCDDANRQDYTWLSSFSLLTFFTFTFCFLFQKKTICNSGRNASLISPLYIMGHICMICLLTINKHMNGWPGIAWLFTSQKK